MSEDSLPFKSVFITGGTGFVGRYFLAALRGRLPAGARIAAPGRELELCDTLAVRAAIAAASPDLVVHLAAQSSVGQSIGAAAETWAVNVGGTLALAAAVTAEVPEAMVIFTSSAEVYGAAFNDGPVDEETIPLPQSVYARTKRAAEELLIDTLAPTNLLRIFRPTNHSGPGQNMRFALPAFAGQIAAIEAGLQPPVIQVGSLVAERDFLDVRDVIEAYCGVLAMPGDERLVTFNVASGRVIPIRLLLDKLLALSNAAVSVMQDPARMRASDIPRTAVDAGRLRARIGWQPVHSLDDTIADVLAKFRRDRNDSLQDYS